MTDPTKGLIASFAFTVFTVVLREQWYVACKHYELFELKKTLRPKISTKKFNANSTYTLATHCYREGLSEVFVCFKPNKKSYLGLVHPELENVQIVTFQAPLHFANVEKFKDMFVNLLSVNIVLRFNGFKKSKANESDDEETPLTSRIIIVDCSAISYVDVMGLDAIKEVSVKVL